MRILIAEDDVTSRTVLASVLKKNGHELVETVDGSEALEELQRPDAPRLVILDWMMPKMDGLEVLRRVRAVNPDRQPYIIMLTIRHEKPNMITGLNAGANDYLGKPFDAGELIARVEVGRRMLKMQDVLAAQVEELRRSRTNLQDLTSRLQAVREEERTLLARELHDVFGQHLTTLQMDLMWVDRHLQTTQALDLAAAQDKIVAMVPIVERLVEQTQTICAVLRPNVLFELGLVAAIEWQAEETAKRGDLVFTLSMPEQDVELDQDCALALFRVVQESLTNVLRHAQASQVEIRLNTSAKGLELVIQDNGRGFPPESISGSMGFGLLGIHERVNTLGGTVQFLNEPGKGAAVWVRIPIPCDKKNP
ncbi:MAG: response regulator [Verrucomicrobia bacterium]|nr:response regulator [Verrucomicrobiota bacterium]